MKKGVGKCALTGWTGELGEGIGRSYRCRRLGGCGGLGYGLWTSDAVLRDRFIPCLRGLNGDVERGPKGDIAEAGVVGDLKALDSIAGDSVEAKG